MNHTNNAIRAILCAMPLALLSTILLLTPSVPADAAPRPTPKPRPTQQIPTPKPRATPIATPIPVANPNAALATCASDIYGLSLSYTKSGGLTSTTARTLSVPTQSKGTINATINAGSTAIYGLTTNSGVQTLAYGSGNGSADSALSVNDASLCYLQFTKTQALPADADSALALLKQTYPGVPQQEAYTTKAITGGYLFTLTTTRPAKGGVINTQTIALSVVGGSKTSQIVLSATSGIGSFAQ
ncbi:MAG: hypothetical protein SH847_05600 [Roseiflexaceae bacterium]|nr:hypothetical protein [Roseiflexaceae bacterium]